MLLIIVIVRPTIYLPIDASHYSNSLRFTIYLPIDDSHYENQSSFPL